MASNSTSKIKVAFGGIIPALPAALKKRLRHEIQSKEVLPIGPVGIDSQLRLLADAHL